MSAFMRSLVCFSSTSGLRIGLGRPLAGGADIATIISVQITPALEFFEITIHTLYVFRPGIIERTLTQNRGPWRRLQGSYNELITNGDGDTLCAQLQLDETR
jgi:hypothetical protein